MKYLSRLCTVSILCLLVCNTRAASAQNLKEVYARLLEQAVDITYRDIHKMELTEEQKSLRSLADQLERKLADTARVAYRKKDYATSTKAYEELQVTNHYEYRSELAEAYLASGNRGKALEAFRAAVYQTVPWSFTKSVRVPPSAKLPGDAISVEDARARYPNEQVLAYRTNNPIELGRFVLLLLENGDYKEAVTIYNEALETLANEDWRAALSLGDASLRLPDRSVFVSAAHTLIVAGMNTNIDVRSRLRGTPQQKERNIEINEALRVKPDYAPALVALADCLEMRGDVESKRLAEEYKAKAELSARGEAQRELVRIRSGRLKKPTQ